MTSVVALSSGVGPMAAGAVYDLTGGYGMFLIAGVIGCLVSGLLVLTLPALTADLPQAASE